MTSPVSDQQVSLEAALEAERASRYRVRQLEAELRVLRGEEPHPGFSLASVLTGGVDEPLFEAPQPLYGNVDDTSPIAGVDSSPENDLVREACSASSSISRDDLRDLVREEVRAQLPRQHGISVYIENEGVARIPAEEVMARTYASVVQVVAQLAARASRVPEEDGMWSLGVGEEESSLLAQIARCAPHRPKAVNRSRSF